MPRAGDFFLHSGSDRLSRLIRFGTRSHWSHAGLIISDFGLTVEALAGGVTQGRLEWYDPANIRAVDTGMDDEQRRDAVSYARGMIGHPYSRSLIVDAAWAIASRSRFFFAVDGGVDCSALVAKALEHGGMALGMDADRYTPADLAALFQVTPR